MLVTRTAARTGQMDEGEYLLNSGRRPVVQTVPAAVLTLRRSASWLPWCSTVQFVSFSLHLWFRDSVSRTLAWCRTRKHSMCVQRTSVLSLLTSHRYVQMNSFRAAFCWLQTEVCLRGWGRIQPATRIANTISMWWLHDETRVERRILWYCIEDVG